MGSDQGSPYEDPDPQDREDRRVREVALQRLLDELTARLQGASEDEVVAELDRTLAHEGFTDMPPRWRQAVTSSIASGEPYVVSVDADTDRARRLDGTQPD